MARPMTQEAAAAFTKSMQDRLMYPFNITFSFSDKIERSQGGKFEDFISEN